MLKKTLTPTPMATHMTWIVKLMLSMIKLSKLMQRINATMINMTKQKKSMTTMISSTDKLAQKPLDTAHQTPNTLFLNYQPTNLTENFYSPTELL